MDRACGTNENVIGMWSLGAFLSAFSRKKSYSGTAKIWLETDMGNRIVPAVVEEEQILRPWSVWRVIEFGFSNPGVIATMPELSLTFSWPFGASAMVASCSAAAKIAVEWTSGHWK